MSLSCCHARWMWPRMTGFTDPDAKPRIMSHLPFWYVTPWNFRFQTNVWACRVCTGIDDVAGHLCSHRLGQRLHFVNELPVVVTFRLAFWAAIVNANALQPHSPFPPTSSTGCVFPLIGPCSPPKPRRRSSLLMLFRLCFAFFVKGDICVLSPSCLTCPCEKSLDSPESGPVGAISGLNLSVGDTSSMIGSLYWMSSDHHLEWFAMSPWCVFWHSEVLEHSEKVRRGGGWHVYYEKKYTHII